MTQQTPRTMQEILEGLSKTTIESGWGKHQVSLFISKGLMDLARQIFPSL